MLKMSKNKGGGLHSGCHGALRQKDSILQLAYCQLSVEEAATSGIHVMQPEEGVGLLGLESAHCC